MYLASRFQAGRMLASKLVPKYQGKPCCVIAIDSGGVIVGTQIAKELHCSINMLLSEEISLPRESESIGGITADGNFTFNPELTQYDIDEIESEFRGDIEQEKLEKIRALHKLGGSDGLIRKDQIAGHNIILVSEGLKSSFELELARAYLKPFKIERLIVATPLASIKVVDWMHVYADEICCLSVVEDYNDTNRYYSHNDVPPKDVIIQTVSKLVHSWV